MALGCQRIIPKSIQQNCLISKSAMKNFLGIIYIRYNTINLLTINITVFSIKKLTEKELRSPWKFRLNVLKHFLNADHRWSLYKVISLDEPHQWLELRICLRTFSPNFLGNSIPSLLASWSEKLWYLWLVNWWYCILCVYA